jgi:SSS family solute:Na+ symporter
MASLAWIDYAIMLVYLLFVLGIGWVLKRRMKTSNDFFLSGRSIPAWITGLAFISANLGAQEVIGMGANGAKYGIVTSHFYWVGAIPAMVFVGIFMMPYYYGSRARSVPEYLKLRFDEKTRGLNAISFAVMTVFSSGVSLYAMAELCNVLLGWDYAFSISVASVVVLCYVFAGGLTSAIYNEVLQFFLIVFGFMPLVYLGLRDVGGWSGLKERLVHVAAQHVPALPSDAYTSSWAHMGSASQNPLGVEWFGLVMGLGFVLSFGYWCTDFLVVQRAMAADSMTAARRTPLIAAIPKMFFPFLVILPGMIALVTVPRLVAPAAGDPAATAADSALAEASYGIIPPKLDDNHQPIRDENGQIVLNYDRATPMMLIHYFPAGLLGLGLTALLASFMSGMAGNVTALNTVWTYDIYQSYIYRTGTDRHYLWMGRFATVAGIALAIVVAVFVAKKYNSIMDVLQLVFAFVNAPLFATFALGMFWRRTTGHGAFFGLLSGTLAAALHHGTSLPLGSAVGFKGGYLSNFIGGTPMSYPSEMAQNFWTAIYAFCTCLAVSVVISMFTRPRPAEELKGLVYSLTPKADEGPMAWYKRPAPLAIAVLALTVLLNFIFR